MARMDIKEATEVLDDWILDGDARIVKVAWGRIRAKLVELLQASHNKQSTPCSHINVFQNDDDCTECSDCGLVLSI